MTSGSKLDKVGWMLPRCLGLLWSLLGSLLLFPAPFMAVGEGLLSEVFAWCRHLPL
jgi:hypothetical protein